MLDPSRPQDSPEQERKEPRERAVCAVLCQGVGPPQRDPSRRRLAWAREPFPCPAGSSAGASSAEAALSSQTPRLTRGTASGCPPGLAPASTPSLVHRPLHQRRRCLRRNALLVSSAFEKSCPTLCLCAVFVLLSQNSVVSSLGFACSCCLLDFHVI
jgi:hypothetical protein